MIARRNKRKGFSLIELLIVVTIILIIAAIAIPNLMRNKIQANETAAVETLRTLNGSILLYSNSYGGFPHALSDMGPASGGTPASSAAADLIDSVLASGVKSGYKFAYAPVASDPSGNVLTLHHYGHSRGVGFDRPAIVLHRPKRDDPEHFQRHSGLQQRSDPVKQQIFSAQT